MNWYSIFYLFSIADRLGSFFGWMAFIFTIINVVSWIVFIIYKCNPEIKDDEADAKIMRKWIWFSTIPFIVFWLGYIAIPTKKDMLLIIAGGSVGEFVTSDSSARQLPADITRFLHAEILKATSEIGNETSDGVKNVVNPEVERIKKMTKDELEKLVLEQLGKKDSLNSN